MAFAAVLTALGYYIILRRFCQGLLKIFLQGAATGGSFPSLPPATPAFGVLPCPCPPPPAGDGSGRSSRQGGGTALPPGTAAAGQATPEQAPRQRAIRPCSGAARRGGRGPLPVRHLFDLPRGRGPSQTPKFLSPGPPSPWLPALLIGNRFLSVLRQTANFCRRVLIWQIL